MRQFAVVGAVLLVVVVLCVRSFTAHTAVRGSAQAVPAPSAAVPAPATVSKLADPPPAALPYVAPAPEFAPVSKLLNDAIAARGLPGAVVVVGHGGKIVFHQAYGSRKLAGEPGLDGVPSAAEPMTEDTIFDLASLTKCLGTATAVMQLYEQGKVALDDPVQKYLPEFNAANDPVRAKVTVRMLLTNTSGEAVDVSLKDPWGLGGADKAEGLHRVLTMPLESGPGEVFRYADINFILLGALLEKVTGQSEDDYVQQNVFGPLGMTETRYLPPAKACGPHEVRGVAIAESPARKESESCPADAWNTSLLSRIAPTARDEENRDDPGKNPDYNYLLRGTVHDPTARRMGGVAGNAGVFSSAHDVAIYAQAMLDALAGRPSSFPLSQSTLEVMTAPEQPGHTPEQLVAANAARKVNNLRYPAVRGQNLFGFGWDVDTPFSKPRGLVFPIGSFGNTGFTGTSLWLDPGSDTYVMLLSNAIHQRGSEPISDLRGDVATAAGRALHLYGS